MVPQGEGKRRIDQGQPEHDTPASQVECGIWFDGHASSQEQDRAHAHADHRDDQRAVAAEAVDVPAQDGSEGVGQHPGEGDGQAERLVLGDIDWIKINDRPQHRQAHADPMQRPRPLRQQGRSKECDRNTAEAPQQVDGHGREIGQRNEDRSLGAGIQQDAEQDEAQPVAPRELLQLASRAVEKQYRQQTEEGQEIPQPGKGHRRYVLQADLDEHPGGGPQENDK